MTNFFLDIPEVFENRTAEEFWSFDQRLSLTLKFSKEVPPLIQTFTEGLDSIYTVLRSTRFNISQLAFNLHCASIYTICFQSTWYSIYSVYHLLGIHSTRYSISSKNHKKTILCLNLHDIHSTQFSIYTVFNLHLFSSTRYSLYTVYHLHWF